MARSETWEQTVVSAARKLPGRDGFAYLFAERRADLRLGFDRDAPPTVHATQQWGARVCVPGRPAQERFCASPAPEDLERLCAGEEVTPSTHSPGVEDAGRLWEQAPRIVQLTQILVETCAAEGMSLQARWVCLEQDIVVVEVGGRVARDRRRGGWLRLRVSSPGGGAKLVEHAFGFDLPSPERLEKLLAEAIARARLRERARPARPGPQRLVLAPGVAGVVVHELVGHALEADTVLRGASRLAQWGDPVAAPVLTVVDDPRRGRAGWRMDDEGTPARATSLIERGRLAGRLHDRATAALAGTASTGHGRRASFRESVHPRMGCTFVAAGPHDPQEVLKETTRGVYVRHMRAGDTEPKTGRAWFRVDDADEIVAGRLGAPLRPFVLELDAHALLKTTDLVADDVAFDSCIGSCVHHGQPLSVSVGAPTLRIGVAKVVT